MRLFLSLLIMLLVAQVSHAQPVPDLGPETEVPLLDDLGALPDTEEDEVTGKAVAAGQRGDKDILNDLFVQLAAAETPELATSIAQKIQLKWLESGSDTVDLLMSRAAEALRAEKFNLALDLLDVVVTLKPDFAEGWNRRATVFYMQEDYGRSLADIEHTLALEPRHWGALSGLGIIQRKLGEDDQALLTFRRALAINPSLKNAREALETLEKAAKGQAI